VIIFFQNESFLNKANRDTCFINDAFDGSGEQKNADHNLPMDNGVEMSNITDNRNTADENNSINNNMESDNKIPLENISSEKNSIDIDNKQQYPCWTNLDDKSKPVAPKSNFKRSLSFGDKPNQHKSVYFYVFFIISSNQFS
jgi:hypothetical protein